MVVAISSSGGLRCAEIRDIMIMFSDMSQSGDEFEIWGVGLSKKENITEKKIKLGIHRA